MKDQKLDLENFTQDKDYLDDVKTAVNDGSYFKDAMDWYFFRYISPICDRTILIFVSALAAVVTYFLWLMIKGAYPQVVKDPMYVRSKDQSLYRSKLVALKPNGGFDNNKEVRSVDEAFLQYMLTNYVKERESYDLKKAEVPYIRKKLEKIRNNSSAEEFRGFQAMMDQENPNSPINFLGRNISRAVNIESLKFIRSNNENALTKIKSYIVNPIPREAEVRFVVKTTISSDFNDPQITSERYLVKMAFDFAGVSREKNAQKKLDFVIKSYKLFKVK